MTIFTEFTSRGRGQPLANAGYLALEQVVVIHATTMDLRWAMVGLLLRAFTAMFVFARGKLALLACRILHGKRCLERGLYAADTMVAAGGR